MKEKEIKLAEQMFEDLDFDCEKTAVQIIYRKSESEEIVVFDLKEKNYIYFLAGWCDFVEANFVSIKLHKAIHQQLIELGELDE